MPDKPDDDEAKLTELCRVAVLNVATARPSMQQAAQRILARLEGRTSLAASKARTKKGAKRE